MNRLIVRLAALAKLGCVPILMSGCVPIIYGSHYQVPSRQNLPDAMPASIESGRTTLADVVLALGDPDTVATDGSWIAYVSRYQEGGGGAALVLLAGSSSGLFGGAHRHMLYRRLLVRLDAADVVTSANLDLVRCSETDVFVGNTGGSGPPCFDVDSADVAGGGLAARLQAAGETNVVVYPRAEWWSTHQRGMVTVSDTTIHFVAEAVDHASGGPDVTLSLADMTSAELGGQWLPLTTEGRRRVVLKRDDAVVAAFVVLTPELDDPKRTAEAVRLIGGRIDALRIRRPARPE